MRALQIHPPFGIDALSLVERPEPVPGSGEYTSERPVTRSCSYNQVPSGCWLSTIQLTVRPAAVSTSSVVIAVRVDLWAGLFLILAVSLFDAGSYLMGAEAAGRWEGPVAGMIGALAVTFTMATIDPPPFDRPSAWLTGVLVAIACVPGQWAASACLPRTTAKAPALRRLDAYIVAGPVFVACTWLLGS